VSAQHRLIPDLTRPLLLLKLTSRADMKPAFFWFTLPSLLLWLRWQHLALLQVKALPADSLCVGSIWTAYVLHAVPCCQFTTEKKGKMQPTACKYR